MTDDPRLASLLDELLDSQRTPEEVCSTCPELLPQVRRRWRQMRRVRAEFDALFPPPSDVVSRLRIHLLRSSGPAHSSRITKSRRCSAAAAWASSIARGICDSTAPSP